MFVVTVLFWIKPDDAARFETAMLENARLSLANEPGCRQFDVCKGQDGQIFLYEAYDTAQAFEDHKATSHFLEFDSKTAPWVAHKEVWIYEKLF